MTTDDKKISELYDSADSIEPPENIDDAILSAARHAVSHKKHAYGPFSGRWPILTSMAALVIITVVVVPIVMQQTPEQAMLDESESITVDGIDKLRKREQPAVSEHRAEPARPARQKLPTTPMNAEETIMDAAPRADSYGAGTMSERITRQPSAQQPETEMLEMEHDTAAQSLMGTSAAPEHKDSMLTPTQWIEKINKLVADKELELARAELKRLREAYPEYQVDKVLLNKLSERQ